MLTNNYYLLQNYFGTNGLVTSASPAGVSIPGVKTMSGETKMYVHVFDETNKNCQPRTGLSIVLGEGETAPSLEDYCLASATNNLNLSCAINTGVEDGAIKTVLTVSGTNGTANEITLKEFGIVKDYYVLGSGTSRNMVKVLIARELLNTPKVVGAGEPFTITFEWSGS